MKIKINFWKTTFIIICSVLVTSCQLGRFVFYNFADIKDHKKFKSRSLIAAQKPFNFETTETGKFPKVITKKSKEEVPFDEFLEENKTVAFLIIKNDTIQ